MNDRAFELRNMFNITETSEINNDHYDPVVDNNVSSIAEDLITVDNNVTNNDESNRGTTRVLYSDLAKASNDLIRFVSRDQKKSKAVLSTLLHWTMLLKEGIDVSVKFDRAVLNSDSNSNAVFNLTLPESNKNAGLTLDDASQHNPKRSDDNNCQRSTAVGNRASGSTVRKKSWTEFNVKKKMRREVQLKKIATSSNLKSNETGAQKVRSYGCTICHKSGHRYKTCPEVTDHGIPLDLKNMTLREQLCERLSSNGINISQRKPTDQRTIMVSVPKSVIGVIIHKLYLKDKNSHNTSGSVDVSNKCAECTFIKDFGRKTYVCSLFNLSCILAYITKSQTNIVISKL